MGTVSGWIVREAVGLVMVLVVAACQGGAQSSPPAGTNGPTVQVSVSSCTATIFGAHIGAATPVPLGTPPDALVSIPSSLQGRLGAYGDSRELVLAPNGWTCRAQDSDPGTILEVASPDGTEFIDLEMDRTSASNVPSWTCWIFASVQRQHLCDEMFGVRPPEEVDRAVTSELVSFMDPPNVLGGSGWNSGGPYETDGLAWYHPEGQNVQSAIISCTVSPADRELCAPILDYFQSALPTPPAGATPAELASFAPTPPATEAPTAPPLGDCAVQLTSANATVVVRGAGSNACTAAKHALLPIGVFYTVDLATATKGLGLICSGPVVGISNKVEVWDFGGATYATMVCRGWDLVSP